MKFSEKHIKILIQVFWDVQNTYPKTHKQWYFRTPRDTSLQNTPKHLITNLPNIALDKAILQQTQTWRILCSGNGSLRSFVEKFWWPKTTHYFKMVTNNGKGNRKQLRQQIKPTSISFRFWNITSSYFIHSKTPE